MKVNRPFKLFFYTLFTIFWMVFAPMSTIKATDGENGADTVEIFAFGDSLTAGYGLEAGDGFTDRLEAWLNANMDAPVKVTNGGVSGDTTSGGRSRLEWGLAPFEGGKPDLVILTLGGNDGLRGIDPTITRENILAMVKLLADRDIPVLIGGMMAPPNLGEEYAKIFNPTYQMASEQYNQPLYPFFLEGVAADPALNQADGIHPNAEGVKIIVSKIGPVVKDLILR